MWGEEWGTMIWGGSATMIQQVPFAPWALLLLGFLLGVCALKAKDSAIARAFPVVVLLLVPIFGMVANAVQFTFQDGQIAYADQVNMNFQELEDRLSSVETSTEQYQIIGDTKNGNSSVQIPEQIISDYCEDVDGCTLTMVTEQADLEPQIATVQFKRNPTPQQNGALEYSDTSQSVGSNDNDGTRNLILSPIVSQVRCRFQDYIVASGLILDDNEVGLHFYPNITAEGAYCALTIRD